MSNDNVFEVVPNVVMEAESKLTVNIFLMRLHWLYSKLAGESFSNKGFFSACQFQAF